MYFEYSVNYNIEYAATVKPDCICQDLCQLNMVLYQVFCGTFTIFNRVVKRYTSNVTITLRYKQGSERDKLGFVIMSVLINRFSIINSAKVINLDSEVKKPIKNIFKFWIMIIKKIEIGIKESTCCKCDYCDFQIPILYSIPLPPPLQTPTSTVTITIRTTINVTIDVLQITTLLFIYYSYL